MAIVFLHEHTCRVLIASLCSLTILVLFSVLSTTPASDSIDIVPNVLLHVSLCYKDYALISWHLTNLALDEGETWELNLALHCNVFCKLFRSVTLLKCYHYGSKLSGLFGSHQ